MYWNILKRILSYIKPYKFYIIGSALCAIASISLTLFAPILVGNAIDFIVSHQNVNFKQIGSILTKLIFVILIGAVFQWFFNYLTNKVSYNTINDLRTQIFKKINSVPLNYIDTHPHGDLLSRIINDIDLISDGLIQGMTQLFSGLVTIIGTVGFMLSVNISITIVVVILTPLSLFVASFIARMSYKMFKEQAKTQGELSGYVEEMISGQKVVKAFGYENHSKEMFNKINSNLYNCGVKAQFYSSLANPSTRFVNGLVYAAVGVIGVISSILSGNLSVGQISCFLAYANQYTKPFNEITGVVTQIQTAFSSAQRVFDVLDEEDEMDCIKYDKPQKSIIGEIDINNVCFSYKPEAKLIQDLNLHVKPGQKVAIVGPTGCGKTTFINLLMRFYDVNSGEIKIDGVPIKNMPRKELRSKYGMVLQETWLFSGTIKQNIAYGKADATDKEVILAAKAAHAHSFIKRLPEGYNTIINENGSGLSQGQKQLLCIARVMLLNSPILILDEATSSIDTRTEMQIQSAFSRMMKGKTSFIVAHRLSTIKSSDIILVMNNGSIVEQGTHKELLKKHGFYSNLYNSQFNNK